MCVRLVVGTCMVLLEILFCVLPLLAKDFFRGTVKKGPIIREYHRHRAGPQSRRKRKTHEKQYRSANNTQNTAESFFLFLLFFRSYGPEERKEFLRKIIDVERRETRRNLKMEEKLSTHDR
jgi:hypothetical protein